MGIVLIHILLRYRSACDHIVGSYLLQNILRLAIHAALRDLQTKLKAEIGLITGHCLRLQKDDMD